MPELVNTQAHRAARNAASIALADAGAGNASIKIYTFDGGTLLAVRALAKPCGAVREADGRIALAQASADDLVLATGAATYATWCDASGTLIASGSVTDADGATGAPGSTTPAPGGVGAFVLDGTGGGTQLYEGGIVRLTTALIG